MGNSITDTSSKGPYNKDPCQAEMEHYLNCVSRHENGLSDGDDCNQETKLYKICRQRLKQVKIKNAPLSRDEGKS